MLRNTSASNGLDSFTIQPKSEAYASNIQRLALLNSRECDFRLAPASRWLLEWGGFPYATLTHPYLLPAATPLKPKTEYALPCFHPAAGSGRH